MSSLADLPELVGFFSYSREDDEVTYGALSALRERIQRELRGQLGRPMKTFRLWQDMEAIPFGTRWETEIKNAVAQSVFFIPIITPERTDACREFGSGEAVASGGQGNGRFGDPAQARLVENFSYCRSTAFLK